MSAKTIDQQIAALEAVTARLEAVEKRLGTGSLRRPATASVPSGSSTEVHPSVAAYDEWFKTRVEPFEQAGMKIGGAIGAQAATFGKLFRAIRDILLVVPLAKKPSQSEFEALLTPLGEVFQTLGEPDKRSPDFNILNAVKEAAGAAGWVQVEKTPQSHVAEAADTASFWGNKARAQFKDSDKDRAEFVGQLKDLLGELKLFIKEYHTTGLAWNAHGDSITAAQEVAAGKKVTPPPPPPRKTGTSTPTVASPAVTAPTATKSEGPKRGGPAPPPPPTEADFAVDSGSGKGASNAALFDAINSSGEGITSGLRKVEDSEKTKYRKEEERVSVVKAETKKETRRRPGDRAQAPAGPPVMELDGSKWRIRNHADNKTIVLDDVNTRQGVQIFNCDGCVIQIKGKVNSIAIDNCFDTAVVFENVLALVEVVNSNKLQIQCTGKVPIVQIDSSTGIIVYIPEEIVDDMTFVSSKSAEMNINVVKDGGEDIAETPIPEQFETKFKGGKWVTTNSSHV